MRAAGGPLTSLRVYGFLLVRSVMTVTAWPRRFLREPPDAHNRSGPQCHMFVRVHTAFRGVNRDEVSQSRFFPQVISRRCSSSPLSLFSSSFPPVSFCFLAPLHDSARLQGYLATPLKARGLLSLFRVTLAPAETVIAHGCPVRTARTRMRAADDSHNQASYKPKD